jgi:predicted nucleic acid-binding protein
MRFLADVNVLSEPTKASPNVRVLEWLGANERFVVVDSIVLGEIRSGILALPHGRNRSQLDNWFNLIVDTIECLPWDRAVGLRWAELVVSLRRKGQSVPVLDSMIAATALEHGLIVATRDTRDFLRTGVEVFDPFTQAS